jgi:predicted O-linked N-acetylglucosamine transferase (SPINDLY family)
MGQVEEALQCFRRVLELKPDHHEVHSNLLFTLNLLTDRSPAEMLQQARAFGDRVAAGATPYQQWQSARQPDKLLRVGLVSGDLRNHPVGFFLEGILSAFDTRQLELVAYASHHPVDDLTDRLKPRFSEWRMVTGMTDESLARLIHDDGIDILIDLAGQTGFNRLPMFAWKPAPVQMSWLGYFATTGVPGMDYFLADPQVAPMDEAAHFSETVWRLPEIYYCFTPPELPLVVAPLPAASNGHVTFGCFNKLAKMNDGVVQTWSRVLNALPAAKLMLKAKELGDAAQRASVLQRYARHGIAPERLILEGNSPRAEYLAAYHQVDIALDPFPFPGGTTTVEGLWMGVPALTLKGDRFIGHQGETILHNAGLADWIAQDTDAYVAKAVAFAGDLAALSSLRANLRGQLLASPVCDAPRFARHFEAALRGMWRQWCVAAPGA